MSIDRCLAWARVAPVQRGNRAQRSMCAQQSKQFKRNSRTAARRDGNWRWSEFLSVPHPGHSVP
eukprot:560438-Rhodomonas_salina.2